LKEGDNLNDTWVGAEPLSTQFLTEEAFSKTRYNKDLSEAYAHHYAAGIEHTSRLRRPSQREGQAQGRRITAVGETCRTAFTNGSPRSKSNTANPTCFAGPLKERVVQDAEGSTKATAPSAWQPFRAAPANDMKKRHLYDQLTDLKRV
jgi:hypothetical protein